MNTVEVHRGFLPWIGIGEADVIKKTPSGCAARALVTLCCQRSPYRAATIFCSHSSSTTKLQERNISFRH
jgi:hypothetical protein